MSWLIWDILILCGSWLTNNGKQQQITIHFKGTEAVGAGIHFTKGFMQRV